VGEDEERVGLVLGRDVRRPVKNRLEAALDRDLAQDL
jgi:hypothetical protein